MSDPQQRKRLKPYLLEGFPEADCFNPILEYIEEVAPVEACGILGRKSQDIFWVPCYNEVNSDTEFRMDSSDFIICQLRYDIFAIVHSHINTSCQPSQDDLKQCYAINLDYYIFNWPDKELCIVKPLIGREYKWEASDCFTLVTDYYRQELGWSFIRRNFIPEWWEKGFDYFSEIPFEEGFVEVTDGSLKKNDLLLFKVGSKIENHCGVYMGEGEFLHHAVNRLSCKESLYPRWNKFKSRVLRYESTTTR